MQLKNYVRSASEKLNQTENGDSARFEVELLMCHVLQCDRSFLFAWPETKLTFEQLAALDQLLTRRLAGEPIAYILQQREFWSLPLYVDQRVLIPRPDTECLVERLLEVQRSKSATLFDLGTGSGAIALALASERPEWHCVAVDFSKGALDVAQFNTQNLGLSSRVSLLNADWLQSCASDCADVIISNPPYIDSDDKHLKQGDVRFEPQSALVSDQQGLLDISNIIEHSLRVLRVGGYLMVEHGWQQQPAVMDLFEATGAFEQLEAGVDHGGQPRFVLAKRRG